MKHTFVVVILALSFLMTNTCLCFGRELPGVPRLPWRQAKPSHAQQIQDDVQKIGVARRITVIHNNGQEFHGTIVSIDSDKFTFDEIDQQVAITVDYTDVKKVRKGYPNKGLFGGKRVRTRTIIITDAALVGGLIVLFAVVLKGS